MLVSSPLSGIVYFPFPCVSFVTLLHFFPSNWHPYSPASPACFWGEVAIFDLQWLMKLLKLCQFLCEFDVFLVILRIALAFLRIAFFIRIFSWNFLQHSNFSYKVISKSLKNIIYLGSALAIFLLKYLTSLCICFTIHFGSLGQFLPECLI